MATAPITEDLFTLGDAPSLLGGRCVACQAVTFPLMAGCPRCGATDLRREELGDRGTLFSWTSQGFPPKDPFRGEALLTEPFTPWYVGLVELPGKIRVETLLVGCDESTLAIDMPLRLVLTPFRHDTVTGDDIVTFAFTPAEESQDD